MRVSVVGNSGSGKSTLSRLLSSRLGATHIELDGIYHQADWQPLPVDEFKARVEEACAMPAWVIDGSYTAVRDLIWERADAVVWLDPPKFRVMYQVIMRTLVRAISRETLWNGNRETWANIFTWDPQESVIAEAWKRHLEHRQTYEEAMDSERWKEIRFFRVRTRRDYPAVVHQLCLYDQQAAWPE